MSIAHLKTKKREVFLAGKVEIEIMDATVYRAMCHICNPYKQPMKHALCTAVYRLGKINI